jgi:predicted transposase YbfD/YdcC
VGTQVQRQQQCCLSSAGGGAEQIARAARQPWGIEIGLHWVLDVVFREDECRVRRDRAPENLALLRKLALGMLKPEPTSRSSFKARRKRAAWDSAYLGKVLAS